MDVVQLHEKIRRFGESVYVDLFVAFGQVYVRVLYHLSCTVFVEGERDVLLLVLVFVETDELSLLVFELCNVGKVRRLMERRIDLI